MAKNQKLDPLNYEETMDLWTRVEELEAQGWGIPALAEALGYADPSALYGAQRELRGIERERYLELCRIHGERRPAPKRQRRENVVTVSGEAFNVVEAVVAELKAQGYDANALAKAAGYGSTSGFRMAMGRRRMPAEAVERLVDLAAHTGVQPSPPPTKCKAVHRSGKTAIDYMAVAEEKLAEVEALFLQAGREVGNPLTRLGFDAFARKVGAIVADAREVVGA